MLTPAMIAAENFSVALTPQQKMNLMLLVRGAYPAHADFFASALNDYLDAEVATPTENTQALKAVLTQLGKLPALDVESQGDVNSPTFYASQANWRALALDVMNVFGIRYGASQQSMGLVQRRTEDLILDDSAWLNQPTPYLK